MQLNTSYYATIILICFKSFSVTLSPTVITTGIKHFKMKRENKGAEAERERNTEWLGH